MTESKQEFPGEETQRPDYWLARWLANGRLRWLLVILLYVIIQPPETGLGIDLCTIHRLTNSPCPGCGMTRSGANIVRGNIRRAWQYHPLGFIFTPVLALLTAASFFPTAIRQTWGRHIQRHERLFRWLTIGFLAIFVVFGLVRFVLVTNRLLSFPMDG